MPRKRTCIDEAISICVCGVTNLKELMGECLDTIVGNGELLPSNVSYEASTNDQNGLLHAFVI